MWRKEAGAPTGEAAGEGHLAHPGHQTGLGAGGWGHYNTEGGKTRTQEAPTAFLPGQPVVATQIFFKFINSVLQIKKFVFLSFPDSVFRVRRSPSPDSRGETGVEAQC